MKTARAAHMIYSLDLAFNIVKATERKFAEWAEGFDIHPKSLWMDIYILYDYAYWYGNKRHRKAVEKILESYAEDPCKGVAEILDGEIEIRFYYADDAAVAAEINACLHRLGIDNVRVLRGCAVVVDDSKKIQEYNCKIIIREDNEIEFVGGPYGEPSGEFKILSMRERRLARRALLRLRRLVKKLENIEPEDENIIWNFLYSTIKTMLKGYTWRYGPEIIENPANLQWWGLPAAAPVGTTVKDLKRLHYLLDAFTVAIELINQKEGEGVELSFKSLPLRKTKEEERRLVSEWSEVFDILAKAKKPLPTPMPYIEDVINQFVENLIEYAPISVIWHYLPDYVPDVDTETIKRIMSPGMLPIYKKIANILIKASGYDI